jgi:hypothetical protein
MAFEMSLKNLFLRVVDIQIKAGSHTALVEPVEWKSVIFQISDIPVSNI